MTDWQPIETAPRDGTAIQARIPGHGEDNIIRWSDGFIDIHGVDCGGWVMAEDQEPPDCWTDGVCWAANEDGNPSQPPTHWKNRSRKRMQAHEQAQSGTTARHSHSGAEERGAP